MQLKKRLQKYLYEQIVSSARQLVRPKTQPVSDGRTHHVPGQCLQPHPRETTPNVAFLSDEPHPRTTAFEERSSMSHGNTERGLEQNRHIRRKKALNLIEKKMAVGQPERLDSQGRRWSTLVPRRSPPAPLSPLLACQTPEEQEVIRFVAKPNLRAYATLHRGRLAMGLRWRTTYLLQNQQCRATTTQCVPENKVSLTAQMPGAL